MTTPATDTETAIVIDILRKNAKRLRQVVEVHKQVAYDAHAKLYKAEVEIDKLKDLLITRDGRKHDITCNSRYRDMSYEKVKSCNCGHFEVQEYLREAAP